MCMYLELNYNTLCLGWADELNWWFNYDDYSIKEISDIITEDKPKNIGRCDYLIALGYIPFFTLKEHDVMQKYIESFNNKSLTQKFNRFTGKDYTVEFWKFFDDDRLLTSGFSQLQEKLLVQKAKEWCEENGIAYRSEN